jgi:hypothetical protein
MVERCWCHPSGVGFARWQVFFSGALPQGIDPVPFQHTIAPPSGAIPEILGIL